jgi:shikimate dehydrogenase
MKRVFGLIGFPLSHSFSRSYFTQKFKDLGLSDCTYQNFELENIEDFPNVIKLNPDLRGLNVTIPHKEKVISFLDEMDDSAQKVGAVNVIKINKDRLVGYNSDFFGFRESIAKLLPERAVKALILGTGGSSKAVCVALSELNIEYELVSRTPGQGQINYGEANALLSDHHIVINTTPLGMSPNTDFFPPIDYSRIGQDHLLFDLIYNPEQTRFLEKGFQAGARIMNGLEMLELQAERSWEIWNS